MDTNVVAFIWIPWSFSEQLFQKQLPVFYKIAVLKNFTKFSGKQLYQSLFFNKVADCGLQFF